MSDTKRKDILSSEEITVELLTSIFEQAYLDYSVTEDNKIDVRVNNENLTINIASANNSLGISCVVYDQNVSFDTLEGLTIANEMNKSLILARTTFMTFEDKVYFLVEYDTDTHKGFYIPQFMSNLKRVSGITNHIRKETMK